MIYVRRDARHIPEKVLKVAERAQRQLELLPPAERREFILKKAHIWTAFIRYLKKMSYGKCWYSESPEVQSFFDVDHYRPKLEARRTETDVDTGYDWLSFSWDNFRLSAQRSNRLSKDEVTEETQGKGSWFPLFEGSPRATWCDRCIEDERPVLLDPTQRADVRLLDVTDTGRVVRSIFCLRRTDKIRVETTIGVLGLNLSGLVEARARAIRDMDIQIDNVLERMAAAQQDERIADLLPIDAYLELLSAYSLPSQPYSAALRARLRNRGLGQLCRAPEEMDP